MQVIKNRSIVDDSWQLLEMDDTLVTGDIIVPLARWLAEQEALQAHNGQVGVLISGGDNLEPLKKQLGQIPLIALSFERFADGRSYSYARLLRERFHFKGELRAVGDVLRDQLNYMKRCGFDSFVMREDQDIQDALRAFDEFSEHYQTAADQAQPIYRQR